MATDTSSMARHPSSPDRCAKVLDGIALKLAVCSPHEWIRLASKLSSIIEREGSNALYALGNFNSIIVVCLKVSSPALCSCRKKVIYLEPNTLSMWKILYAFPAKVLKNFFATSRCKCPMDTRQHIVEGRPRRLVHQRHTDNIFKYEGSIPWAIIASLFRKVQPIPRDWSKFLLQGHWSSPTQFISRLWKLLYRLVSCGQSHPVNSS